MMRVKPASSGRLKYTIAAGLSVALLLLYVLYRLADNDTRLRRLESSQAAGAGAVAAAAAAAAHKPVKGSSEQLITTSRQSTQDKPATAVKPIPQLNSRTDIAQLLESEGLTTGAELGVLVGDFAEHTLNIWQGCKTYYLVDLWAKQVCGVLSCVLPLQGGTNLERREPTACCSSSAPAVPLPSPV